MTGAKDTTGRSNGGITVAAPYQLLLEQLAAWVCCRPWRVSVQKHSFENVLRSECRDLLVGLRDSFHATRLILFWIILWNDLERDWDRSTPFLTTRQTKDHILKYLWLEDELSI